MGRALLAALLLCSACAHRRARPGEVTCGDSLEVFGAACLALPKDAGPDTPVVMYLHGMYPASAPQETLEAQRLLARLVTEAGFALLIPRGRLGLCDWHPDLLNWYCWPASAAVAGMSAEMALGWELLWQGLEQRLGPSEQGKPRRRFLLGYSNGGFFAALLAARGDVPFDGYAIVDGGPVEPAWFDPGRAAPVLLLSAQDDRWQAPLMEHLHQLLDEAGWPHDYRLRKGGHALTRSDVEGSLGFFEAHR